MSAPALLRNLQRAQTALATTPGPVWVPWPTPSPAVGHLVAALDARGLLGCGMEADVLLAGGAVAHWAMHDAGLAIPGSAPPKDLDLFVLSVDGADAVTAAVGDGQGALLLGGCRAPGVVDLGLPGLPLPLQVLYGWLGRTPAEILQGFDMDYVCAALRRGRAGGRGLELELELGVMYGTLQAWQTRVTRIVDPRRLWIGRLDKAAAKGFSVAAEDDAVVAAVRAAHARECAVRAEALAASLVSARPAAVDCTDPGPTLAAALSQGFVMGVRHAVFGAPGDPYGRPLWGAPAGTAAAAPATATSMDCAIVATLHAAGTRLATGLASRFAALVAGRATAP